MVHDRKVVSEHWNAENRKRLFDLIEDIPGTFLLSGDVHTGEIILYPCNKYPLVEFTTSGMTHTAFNQYSYFSLLYIYLWMPFTYNVGPRAIDYNWGSIQFE